MNAFTNYLEKLGSNFLVAAMVPSLGLVIASMLAFDPILHVSDMFLVEDGIYSLVGISLLVAVPTVIIGFTLTALNTYILKVFEGYVFFNRFVNLRDAYARKANKLINRRETLKKRIAVLKDRNYKTKRVERLLDILNTKYYSVVSEYDQLYPPTTTKIMPTKFGNILKASEAYSGTRYGIDAVQFWPRLWHVIPPSYRQSIDETRNELSFLVNMSTLSVFFYFLCFLAILYTLFGLWPGSSATNLGFAWLDNAFRYVVAGFVALLFNRFFYHAAIFSVGDYGIMIRSAYDLFRLDLLEQFRLKHPKGSVEEFQVWRNLGELIVLGQESLEFKPLKYEVKQDNKKK